MTIKIRDAAPSDAAFVVDANARLAHETENKMLDHAILESGVAAALSDPAKARYWIAEIQGKPTGQLMVTLEWSDWRNGYFWWIQSVYVHQAFRQQGVFKALYRHVSQLAIEAEDVCGLRLYVERENHAAQSAYETLGMSRTPYQLFEEIWHA